MVFGMNKRDRRAPDLSRYDYHYQNKDDFNKSPRLSAAAAHAASVGANAPVMLRSQPQRSQSMVHTSGQATRKGSAHRGAVRVPRSAPAHNYRSYSLRSQSSAQPRRDSLASNNSAAVRARNGGDSRSNSIVVKTTEVRDPQGRTQSITRKTIRRANGYEYVETTTTTTQAIPVVDAERHFDEFSGNYVMQDDGIEELSEEEQGGREHHTGHAYAALTAHAGSPQGLLSGGSDGEVPLDQTSSISQFSDAQEYVPDKARRQNRRPTKSKSTRRPVTAENRKSQPVVQPTRQNQPRRALTEKEMYERAYAIAQQNVYKTDDVSTGTPATQSRMGQRTLRDSVAVDGAAVASTVSSARPKSKPSRISSFFQRNAQNEASPQSAPAVIDEPQTRVPKSTAPKAPLVTGTSKPKLSDEEMYRHALAIAQERYGQNQTPVPTKPEPPVEPKKPVSEPVGEPVGEPVIEPVPLVNRPEPEETIPSGPVQRSNSDVEEHDSDMFEAPEATTTTKTTTPEANGGGQISEWERYDMEHPEPEDRKERKSKFKNMLDKVKQFSIENSGYQASKETPSKSKPHVVEQTTEEIKIVEAVPLQRNQSTSSHGASTTKNVEATLEPTNRHFNDQASESSFHKSVKKSVVEEPPLHQQETTSGQEVVAPKGKSKKTKNRFFKKLFNRS